MDSRSLDSFQTIFLLPCAFSLSHIWFIDFIAFIELIVCPALPAFVVRCELPVVARSFGCF
jgi:hypothetical protein